MQTVKNKSDVEEERERGEEGEIDLNDDDDMM